MKRSIHSFGCRLAALLMLALPAPVLADDHGDGTAAASRRGADIGSVYFFLDPNDNNLAVVAVTIGGFIPPAMNSYLGFFESGVRFVFNFENTGDAIPDYTIKVRHSAQISRTVPQTATVKLPPHPELLPEGRTFTAPTTISRAAFGPQGPPTFGGGTSAQQTSTVTTDADSGVSYFAGLIDDPFFFDQAAELAYRNSRFANQTNPAILTRGRDSFAGYNTTAIVLRIPITLLKGPDENVVGLTVHAQVQRPVKRQPGGAVKSKWVNLDRMGNPFINNLLTSFATKDGYNRGTTVDDKEGKFATDIVSTLQALQTDGTSINILSGIYVVNGDILRLSTTIPNTGTEGGKNPEAAWPNGRRPNDDVINTVITLVNNRVSQGDTVSDNELPMRGLFPFFAQPHMPFPPGAGSEDLTRN